MAHAIVSSPCQILQCFKSTPSPENWFSPGTSSFKLNCFLSTMKPRGHVCLGSAICTPMCVEAGGGGGPGACHTTGTKHSLPSLPFVLILLKEEEGGRGRKKKPLPYPIPQILRQISSSSERTSSLAFPKPRGQKGTLCLAQTLRVDHTLARI